MNITSTSPATSLVAPQFEVGTQLDVAAEINEIVSAPKAVETASAETIVAAKKIHVCPGHTEFFHRYMKEKKADKKATKEVEEVKKDSNIKDASFTVISKKDNDGAKSGYFNGLNKIFSYAVLINFSHVDDSAECPYNPANKA